MGRRPANPADYSVEVDEITTGKIYCQRFFPEGKGKGAAAELFLPLR